MKTTILVLCAASILLATSCTSSSQPDNGSNTPLRALSADEQQIASASNSFGLNLFKQAARFEAGKNMFVAPLSYAMALGMTYNGANGATRDSMAKALELQGMNLQAANAAYQTLIALLLSTDNNVEFRIANSIWYNQRFTVEQPFLSLARQYFDAEVRATNFADASAKDVVNAWVEQKTNGKIKNLIQSPFDPNVDLMTLINAIYFNGSWKYRFESSDTKSELFQPDFGLKRAALPCTMMNITKPADFGVSGNADFQAFDIPYGNGQFSMTILLPQGKTLGEAIANLTPAAWNQLTSRFVTSASLLALPKFKLETRYEESPKQQRELHALGMGIAFDGQKADFTNLYQRASLGGENAYIGKVIHQTFVQVDERGTEAAAATAGQVAGPTSIIANPKTLRVDRPFAFFIREKNSQTILFAGTMYVPTN